MDIDSPKKTNEEKAESSFPNHRTVLGTINEETFVSFSFNQSERIPGLISPFSSNEHVHVHYGFVDAPFPSHKTGAGFRKNKRDVKREAVEKLLASLHVSDSGSGDANKFSCGETGLGILFDIGKDSDCPVEDLHKLCSRRLSLVPHYVNEIDQTGLPHKKSQTVLCKVGPLFTERGRGYTLKQAKKNAAYKMFHKIETYLKSRESEDSENICDFDVDDSGVCDTGSSNLVQKLFDLNIKTGHPSEQQQ